MFGWAILQREGAKFVLANFVYQLTFPTTGINSTEAKKEIVYAI